MGLLTCGCLNVKVHVKNTDLKQVDLSSVEGSDPNEQFFAQKISTAHLNLEGVIVEHWCLVKKKRCGLWILHRCVNCNTWSHALRQTQGSSLILVSMALQNEETKISSLEHSADFSPLYKVILRDKNDNQPIQPIGVQSEKYESLQQTLTTIQQQLNKFLVNEENAMEERIKDYENSQRSAFANLQKKARQDKNNLIRMILNEEDCDEVDGNETPAVLDNMTSQPSPRQKIDPVKTNMTKSTPVKKSMGFKVEESMKPVQSSTSTVVTASPKVVQAYSKSTSALSSRLGNRNPVKESDPHLFDMDPTFGEDDVSSRPFYNSDDDEENEDTDDSELDSPATNPAMYSTSVPISVPCWKSKARQLSQHGDLDENDESPTDPNNIAASIKALARSVQHNDGSEIFGDLPRRPRQAMAYGSSVM